MALNINSVIPNLGFHHVGLKVADIEKSTEFYKALGMTVFAEWGEGAGKIRMMSMGENEHGDCTGIIELFAGGGNMSDNGMWVHFAMRVDNVENAYNTALAAGARTVSAPKSVALDSKPQKMTLSVAFVYGPDNEQLEFFRMV